MLVLLIVIFHTQWKKKQTSKVAKSWEEHSKPLIKWLKDNKMNLNLDKFHLTLTKCENLLGVTFNNKTNFQSHLDGFRSIASRKLHALAHAAPYIDLPKEINFNSCFFFLIPSLTILHLYGCVTAVHLITKYTSCMKNVLS